MRTALSSGKAGGPSVTPLASPPPCVTWDDGLEQLADDGVAHKGPQDGVGGQLGEL